MRIRTFLALPLLSLALARSPPQGFVNTAIARTVELGGATTQSTTQFNIKATSDGEGEYWLALAGDGDLEPAWWEVAVGGKVVEVEKVQAGAPTVAVSLGQMKNGETKTLSLTAVLTHTSTPMPLEIAQSDPQYLLWKSNSTYVDSWYPSDVERIKIRSPSANILSYASVPQTYTRDSDVTKASSTLTLGPFNSVPATLHDSSTSIQQPFHVHYETSQAVIGLKTLRRSAEVSHWGANLNIQDEMALVNMGPKLKGQFSRLAHQQSRFHASKPAQILADLTLRVPPTAHSPYYYDIIGNVSTSHFRQGSTPAQSQARNVRSSPRTVDGALELRPRYPLLGGWNYTFVIGYDMPLGDALKAQDGKKVLGVPFLTSVRDLVVDDVELRIILPEGARDIEIFAPFPVDNITHSIHKTYLDSTGRPAITLTKARCTENHAQTIYVTYSYPISAQVQKPLTVAAVIGGLFILAMGLRRVDYRIDTKKIQG